MVTYKVWKHFVLKQCKLRNFATKLTDKFFDCLSTEFLPCFHNSFLCMDNIVNAFAMNDSLYNRPDGTKKTI